MTIDEILILPVDQLFNQLPIIDIPLINIVKIDNNLFGKFDIIINRYYGGDMRILPLLLAFNKITDQTEVKLGTILELPNFDILFNQLTPNTILSDNNIPGISKTMDNKIINNETIKATNSTNLTTASPKLQITLKKVSYDLETGILSY